MPDVGVGSFAIRSSFTQGSCYSTVGLGYCPPSANGTGYGMVIAAYGAVSGNGGTRSGVMFVGIAQWAFSRASAGSAQDTGWVGTSTWTFTSGQAATYGYTSLSGSCYFARGPNGSGFTQGAFGTWSGSVGMYYRYIYNPTAPTGLAVTPNLDGDEATISWTAPGDNGGSALTGYRVQRDTVNTFNSPNLATVSAAGVSTLMTGLTPGVLYYYRVTARNTVSDAVGVLGGAWSSTISQLQPEANGLGRVWNGSAFVAADANVWDGASWVDAEMRVANGSLVWVEAGG